jgi:hypothetical protein
MKEFDRIICGKNPAPPPPKKKLKLIRFKCVTQFLKRRLSAIQLIVLALHVVRALYTLS